MSNSDSLTPTLGLICHYLLLATALISMVLSFSNSLHIIGFILSIGLFSLIQAVSKPS